VSRRSVKPSPSALASPARNTPAPSPDRTPGRCSSTPKPSMHHARTPPRKRPITRRAVAQRIRLDRPARERTTAITPRPHRNSLAREGFGSAGQGVASLKIGLTMRIFAPQNTQRASTPRQPSTDTLTDDSVAAFRGRPAPIALHLTVWEGTRREPLTTAAPLGVTPRLETLAIGRRPGRCESPTGEPRRQWDPHPSR
jgi:hypothetical protein